MAEKLMKIIADCSTGAIHELELTADEIAEREVMLAELAAQEAARQVELEAQEAAKASAIDKLKKLGLSDSEIAALV